MVAGRVFSVLARERRSLLSSRRRVRTGIEILGVVLSRLTQIGLSSDWFGTFALPVYSGQGSVSEAGCDAGSLCFGKVPALV